MTTGETTYYKLTYPYGDEPMSNVDDIIRKLADDIDRLMHNAAVAGVVAARLYWTGDQAMTAGAIVEPTYEAFNDYTGGVGLLPDYTFEDGMIVPSTGIWHAEVWNRYDNANASGTNVTIDATITLNGTEFRTVPLQTDITANGIQVISAWTGWAAEGDTFRGRARSSRTGVDLRESAVRLIGPMNLGAGFLGGGL